MKIKLIFYNLILLIVMSSCCFGAKEDYLGNNIYLSEFSNVERQILYQKESCAVTGIEIVPMTVLEISYNSEWIIAKSGNKRKNGNYKYWVIKNSYDNLPNSETVIKNTIEFNDFESFNDFVIDNNITLILKKID